MTTIGAAESVNLYEAPLEGVYSPAASFCSFCSGGLIQDVSGSSGGTGGFADEALGVVPVSGRQDIGSPGLDCPGPPVVDIGGGVQAEAAVAVHLVGVYLTDLTALSHW